MPILLCIRLNVNACLSEYVYVGVGVGVGGSVVVFELKSNMVLVVSSTHKHTYTDIR